MQKNKTLSLKNEIAAILREELGLASNNSVDRLFDLFSQERKQWEEDLREKMEGLPRIRKYNNGTYLLTFEETDILSLLEFKEEIQNKPFNKEEFIKQAREVKKTFKEDHD